MPNTIPSENSSLLGTLVGLAVLGGMAAAIWFWIVPDKYRYAVEYDVPSEKVYVQDKPHDCEWEKAPLGNKYCHFERRVAPSMNDKGVVTEVYINWDKVAE